MVLAPMPGAVVLVDAAKGKTVKRGERLLVLQAMKMEYSLVAPLDGTVTDLTVSAGSQVKEGALLARIEKVTEL
jgi:3-methylcrotonyl-CoA carboxylase alpha subunit